MNMAINKMQVAPYLAFKTRREYIRVALTPASLLSTVLYSKQETTHFLYNLHLVHNHFNELVKRLLASFRKLKVI